LLPPELAVESRNIDTNNPHRRFCLIPFFFFGLFLSFVSLGIIPCSDHPPPPPDTQSCYSCENYFTRWPLVQLGVVHRFFYFCFSTETPIRFSWFGFAHCHANLSHIEPHPQRWRYFFSSSMCWSRWAVFTADRLLSDPWGVCGLPVTVWVQSDILLFFSPEFYRFMGSIRYSKSFSWIKVQGGCCTFTHPRFSCPLALTLIVFCDVLAGVSNLWAADLLIHPVPPSHLPWENPGRYRYCLLGTGPPHFPADVSPFFPPFFEIAAPSVYQSGGGWAVGFCIFPPTPICQKVVFGTPNL